MATNLDVSVDDLRFLVHHLERYIAALDDELIHSDKREIQHELASDVDRLQRLRDRLATAH